MQPTPEYAIFEQLYTYAKIYPDMTKLFKFDEPVKVRTPGYEPLFKEKPTHRRTQFDDPITLIDSLRRTKTRLSDVIVCNKFNLFCTFTFARNRQDVALLKKRMSKWLDHQNQRVGKFEYLIVPEFHKDGKSIHFHALFKDYPGNMVDSGHRRKDGRVVYNIKNYRLGFSTATKIDTKGVPLVASYVKKYITKDMPQFNGKKRYWCSQGLIRPEKIKNPIVFPFQEQKFTEEYKMKNNILLKIAHEKLNLIAQMPKT